MSKSKEPKKPKEEPVHPDVTYIEQFAVGRVICRGLSVVAKLRPEHPVEYLAKWLLSYQHQSDVQQQMAQKERRCEEARRKHAEKLQKLEEEKKHQQQQEERIRNRTLEFEKAMGSTEDLVDLLDDFAEYLKATTGATGVYIGRLEQTKKEIKEGDNDAAHVDEAGAQIIKYISASKDHRFMVGKSLKMTEGVTPDVFAAVAAEPAQPAAEPVPPAEPKKEDPAVVPVQPPVDLFKGVIYRPEVTREPRMKFFRVPRLGCYMAVPLVYSSCLFTESFVAALADFAAYREKVKKNEEATKEYQDRLAQAKAEKEAEEQENQEQEEGEDNEGSKKEDENEKEKEMEKGKEKEKAKAKEKGKLDKSKEKANADKTAKNSAREEQPHDEEKALEPPKLEEAKEPEYKTKPLSYVVCLDTLGQDRGFAEEQKRAVAEMVHKYKLRWEDRERLRLTSDRKLKESEKEKDPEFQEKVIPGLQEEEDKAVEEQIAALAEERELGEEEKKAKEKLIRRETKAKSIATGALKDKVLSINGYNVVKLPRIMQTLFYLLSYKCEDLCEPETNKLFWKKAHLLWNEELLAKFQTYTPIGPKQGEYKKYQKINFLEKNLEGITEEDVRVYSLGLGKLFSCIVLTLELRKDDIMRRKATREKLQKERDEAIQRSEQRTKERADELKAKREEAQNEKKAAEKQKAAEEKKEEASAEGTKPAEPEEVFKFDDEEFLKEWDTKNPPVEVPPEVKEERDDDYDFDAAAAAAQA